MILFLLTAAVLLNSFSGAMVIQSHWSNVRMRAIPPVRIESREGGEVVLHCSATGSPAPQVAWYKDSVFVSHMDWSVEQDVSSIGETVARLVLSCASPRDAGVYECRARAGEHEVSVTTEVLVEGGAEGEVGNCVETGRPRIMVWKETYMLEEGDTATLPCRLQAGVMGHQVTWRNGQGHEPANTNDVRFEVQENGDLVIHDVRFTDMGQYSCTVNGSGGSETVHTFLYPLSPERDSSNK